MAKDTLGQDIGPGDIAFDLDNLMLVVVVEAFDGMWKCAWLDTDERKSYFSDVKAGWLLRLSDYSDVSEEIAQAIRDLEDLYMTITGERYG